MKGLTIQFQVVLRGLLSFCLLATPSLAAPGEDYLCQWKGDLQFYRYYHWYRHEFPLKVYIPPVPEQWVSSHENNYPQLVQEAFLNWAEVYPELTFNWTQKPAEAQIQIVWQEHFPESEKTWGRAALPTPFIRKGAPARINHKSTLFLALKAQPGSALTPGKVLFSGAEFLAIATHEAGHALGLMHSNNPDDIMYHAIYARFDGQWRISPADAASVQRLYSLPENLEMSPCNG
jgi:predicted Zn-dependent protease